MNHATRLLAALAASVLPMLAVAPAHADSTSEDCASDYMTASEFAQLDFGTRLTDVLRIVGGPGVKLRSESTATLKLRQWDWCTGGEYYANQWLGFERSPAGPWVITEIR